MGFHVSEVYIHIEIGDRIAGVASMATCTKLDQQLPDDLR
jgi:hypothetical protein